MRAVRLVILTVTSYLLILLHVFLFIYVAWAHSWRCFVTETTENVHFMSALNVETCIKTAEMCISELFMD